MSVPDPNAFPEVIPEAQAAYRAAFKAIGFDSPSLSYSDRKMLAAFLREAINQVDDNQSTMLWHNLQAIANSLHTPEPR